MKEQKKCENKKNDLKRLKMVTIILVILILAYFLYRSGAIPLIREFISTKNFTKQMENKQIEKIEDIENEEEVYATSHKTEEIGEFEEIANLLYTAKETEDIQEPLTQDAVTLRDIYTEERDDILLKVFYPGALEYKWEIYDIESREWAVIEQMENIKDELYRQISVCKVSAKKGIPHMIRCITTTDTETHTDISNIHVLEKEIKEIEIEDYEAESGTYINALDIPVTVRYVDGSEEEITGLYGLYFLEENISKMFDESVSGNMIETTTTILTEKEYTVLGIEEKEVVMRYRMNNCMNEKLILTGKDIREPDIAQVECSGYEVTNISKTVPVKVSVQAEDNETPYPYLQYAFLPEGKEPQEEDWKNTPQFEAEIDKNGNWITYCKDQSGNIATAVQELIVVDQKVPEIDIKLKNKDWCVSTRIMVEVQDALTVKYHYSCPEQEIDSGWIDENQFLIEDNGCWIVKVQDAAGNISEQEIRIDNIDKEVPVILGIVEE